MSGVGMIPGGNTEFLRSSRHLHSCLCAGCLGDQSLQRPLYNLSDLCDHGMLILSKKRGKAVVGYEGFSVVAFINGKSQRRIERDFRHVFDHLDRKQWVADRVLNRLARFPREGEYLSLLDFTENSEATRPQSLLNRFGDLLPGRFHRRQLASELIRVAEYSHPVF